MKKNEFIPGRDWVGPGKKKIMEKKLGLFFFFPRVFVFNYYYLIVGLGGDGLAMCQLGPCLTTA